MALFNSIRVSCRQVAEWARHVSIREKEMAAYATSLPRGQLRHPQIDPRCHLLGRGRDTVAFFLTLNAVNFGSGYFPRLKKRPGTDSGYLTVAAALTERFSAHGPPTAQELILLSAEDCTRLFGQDPTDPAIAELMVLFARALNDLGSFLTTHCHGDFSAVIDMAENSAERLVELLAAMPLYRDVARYHELQVPFYKRAQLTVADLFIAFAGEGPGRFTDIDGLTIFADNLVPHVLRLDGILEYEEDLGRRIAAGEEIPSGAPQEVELRACAVHAAELLVAQLRRGGEEINSLYLDQLLWARGHEPRYRKRPRHHTRTPFY